MTEAQAERAINQLYESDTLRSELRDEEASLLLSWGEKRLSEFADRNLPDDQFDDLSNNFRALLVAINVCVGKRKTSPSQHLPMMASISSAAEASGYSFHSDDQKTFLKHQSALSNQDAISELLGLLRPSEVAQPTVQNTAVAAVETVPPPATTVTEANAEAVQLAPPEALPEPTVTPINAPVETVQPAPSEALPEQPETVINAPAETAQTSPPEELPEQAVTSIDAPAETAQTSPPEALPESPVTPIDAPAETVQTSSPEELPEQPATPINAPAEAAQPPPPEDLPEQSQPPPEEQ